MKQTLFFVILFSFMYKPVFSQNENDTVYWYYVRYDLNIKNEQAVKIKKRGKIYSGSIKKYDRELWKYLGQAAYIANGPFNAVYEAEQSKNLYRFMLSSNYSDTTILTAYKFRIKMRPRSRSYQMIINPNNFKIKGSYSFILSELKTSLTESKFIFGPFFNKNEHWEQKINQQKNTIHIR